MEVALVPPGGYKEWKRRRYSTVRTFSYADSRGNINSASARPR